MTSRVGVRTVFSLQNVYVLLRSMKSLVEVEKTGDVLRHLDPLVHRNWGGPSTSLTSPLRHRCAIVSSLTSIPLWCHSEPVVDEPETRITVGGFTPGHDFPCRSVDTNICRLGLIGLRRYLVYEGEEVGESWYKVPPLFFFIYHFCRIYKKFYKKSNTSIKIMLFMFISLLLLTVRRHSYMVYSPEYNSGNICNRTN